MNNSLKNKQIIVGFLLLLTFITTISPFNVVKGLNNEEPQYGEWLMDCVYTDAEVLNPVLSTNSTSSYIESFLFERMLTYDKDMHIVPELALAWEISPNKLEYTFHLREDVYWHDNVQFTADDVIFTYDRILDPRTQTTRASMFEIPYYENLPIEKKGDFTVTFHITTTLSPMLNFMMFPIIPKHIFEEYSPAEGEGDYMFNDCPPNYAPIGTGCMMFDEWIRDNQTVLIRNSCANGGPGYWREHDAYLDGVIIKVIPEITTQFHALRNGEIDMMDLSSIDFSEVNLMNLNLEFTFFIAPQFASEHIAFNCDPSKGHHADIRNFTTEPNYFSGFDWMEDDPAKLPGPNIRKALNYAIDKDQIIKVAYAYGYRNLGPIYLAQTDWYYEGVERYDYDLTKANQLLADAGFGVDKDDHLRKNLNFTISYNTGNIRRQTICNYAKGQWGSLLGLDISVEKVEWESMLVSHYDHRKFDAMSTGWNGGGKDPDITNVWHSKSIMPGGKPSEYNPDTFAWEWEGDPVPGGLNYMGYWNPEIDNLLNIAREESEDVVRKMYYNQIQEIIVNDSPYVWLFSQVTLVAVSQNIHCMVHGSVAGLWPQPVGFHNIWKSASPLESSTITSDQSTNTSDGFIEVITLGVYLLPILIFGGFFAVGGLVGILLRKR